MVTKSVVLCASVLAFGLSSAALAQPVNHPINPGVVSRGPVGLWDPSLSLCPAGWVANPTHIDPNNPYGQSYTCTGPRIVCNHYFSPVKPVVGTIPGGPGTFGTSIFGSPVVILPNGQMQYTCTEPPRIQ